MNHLNSTSIEDNINEAQKMLLLINDSTDLNIRSIVNQAEDRFHGLLSTYPKESLPFKERSIYDIQAMILQQYITAINCINDRCILSDADELVAQISNDWNLEDATPAMNLYRSLIQSQHPIIKISARYNLAACLFNTRNYSSALQTMNELETLIIESMKAQDSDNSTNNIVNMSPNENSDPVNRSNNDFKNIALSTVRKSIQRTLSFVKTPIKPIETSLNKKSQAITSTNMDINVKIPSHRNNSQSVVMLKPEAGSVTQSPHHPSAQANDVEPFKVYPYSMLRVGVESFPADVIMDSREMYLSNDEFFSVFRMTRDDWVRLPKWKKILLKKNNGLF